jgi:hypothetical protein
MCEAIRNYEVINKQWRFWTLVFVAQTDMCGGELQHAGRSWRTEGAGHYVGSRIGSRADYSPNNRGPWRAHLDNLRAYLEATVALPRHGEVWVCVRTTILFKTHRHSSCRFTYTQFFLISDKKISRPSVHQFKVACMFCYFTTLGLEIMTLKVIRKFHFLILNKNMQVSVRTFEVGSTMTYKYRKCYVTSPRNTHNLLGRGGEAK